MASLSYHPDWPRFAVIMLLLIFSPSFSPSTSVGSVCSNDGVVKQTKSQLGSRPPQCVNRCLNCRPCMAVLVTPPHHNRGCRPSSKGDESYYPLSWRCKCGDKYFKP